MQKEPREGEVKERKKERKLGRRQIVYTSVGEWVGRSYLERVTRDWFLACLPAFLPTCLFIWSIQSISIYRLFQRREERVGRITKQYKKQEKACIIL